MGPCPAWSVRGRGRAHGACGQLVRGREHLASWHQSGSCSRGPVRGWQLPGPEGSVEGPELGWEVGAGGDGLVPAEMDEAMRSFAEKVFASEVKDDETRHEISPFDVEEICPISHHEMQEHLIHQESQASPEKQ